MKEAKAFNNITQEDLTEFFEVIRQTIHAIDWGKFYSTVILALALARMVVRGVNYLLWHELSKFMRQI